MTAPLHPAENTPEGEGRRPEGGSTPLPFPLPATMRAAACRRYGPPEVVILTTLPRPDPGPGAVLVRVQAAGVTTGDARLRAASAPRGMALLLRLAFGLTAPRKPVPGREFAGIVVATGPGVTGFAPGDAVFGVTPGLRLGAHAGYLTLPANGLLRPLPATLNPVEGAAFCFGGLTAADFLLDQMALSSGARLLVVGATGAVGSAAVQIAHHHGAQVTALASAGNLVLAQELGAHRAMDYREGLPGGPFDGILDVPGVITGAQATTLLAPGGQLGRVTATLGQTLGAAMRPSGAVRAGVVRETPGALDRLLALHGAGAYRPLVGASLPFEQIVAANALASGGHKRGNVVVTFPDH